MVDGFMECFGGVKGVNYKDWVEEGKDGVGVFNDVEYIDWEFGLGIGCFGYFDYLCIMKLNGSVWRIVMVLWCSCVFGYDWFLIRFFKWLFFVGFWFCC